MDTQNTGIFMSQLHDRPKSSSFNELSKMTRSYCVNRFQSISGVIKPEISEAPNPDDFVYGTKQVVIIIAGNEVKITLKIHFMEKDVKKLLLRLEKDVVNQSSDQDLIYDRFKEYANLVAGAIKTQLEVSGMICGISLPILSSGFDEIVTSDRLRSRSFYDYFIISNTDVKFTVTLAVDAISPDFLNNYTFNPSEDKSVTEYDLFG